MDLGIVSYGAYIPRLRITPEAIGRVWGVDGKARGKGLGVESKSVPNVDEDVATIAVAAARSAIRRAGLDPKNIEAIYVGSESHPYAVKPTAGIVGEAIGATPVMTAADFEFACKAGTAAMQAAMGVVAAGFAPLAMAIGADTSQGAPGDALEYTASAGGAAYIIGKENFIARINDTVSYTTDTPDFWRREGARYPSHGGRFTGEPAYFKHTLNCAARLMERMGTDAKDYQYAIFHQPNGKFPVTAAKRLGFTAEQVQTGLLTPRIGNTYSGAVPLGLAAVLDAAKPGDRIFAVAYGSGAGSDGFDITVTENMKDYKRSMGALVEDLIARKAFVEYGEYAKIREKIAMKCGGE